MKAICKLIEAVIINRSELKRISVQIGQLHRLLNHFHNRMEDHMANQEERLQAILAAVKNVKQMLAELKANNPQIEDEITAIESELAPAEPPVEPV